MRAALLLTATLVLFMLAPAGSASTSATTPAGAACVLVDSDSCGQTWDAPQGAYFLSVAGSFEGTTSITVSSVASPWISFTQTCSGTLVGVVMTNGGCWTTGTFPLGPMDVDCASSGVGSVVCSVAGQ